MRAFAVTLLTLLLFGVGPTLGQEWVTVQGVSLVPATTPKLSTSGKDALSSTVTVNKPEGSIELLPEVRVRLISRSRFIQKETLYDRENSTSTSTNRLFKVAFVEVLSGETQGQKGWVVISYRDTGGDPQVFLTQAPPSE
jgi:hypothetical protein